MEGLSTENANKINGLSLALNRGGDRQISGGQ
jgi:hypothetical protein